MENCPAIALGFLSLLEANDQPKTTQQYNQQQVSTRHATGTLGAQGGQRTEDRNETLVPRQGLRGAPKPGKRPPQLLRSLYSGFN